MPKSATTCTHGHDLTRPGAVAIWSSGRRRCKACERERRRTERYKAAHRKAVRRYDDKDPLRCLRSIQRIRKLREKTPDSPLYPHQLQRLRSGLPVSTEAQLEVALRCLEAAQRTGGVDSLGLPIQVLPGLRAKGPRTQNQRPGTESTTSYSYTGASLKAIVKERRKLGL